MWEIAAGIVCVLGRVCVCVCVCVCACVRACVGGGSPVMFYSGAEPEKYIISYMLWFMQV